MAGPLAHHTLAETAATAAEVVAVNDVGRETATISVYVCDGCGAKHRQLFLLEHDEDCVTDFWHVESVRRDNGSPTEDQA